MVSNSSDLKIRTMTRSEVDLALDWAANEGWNPGIHDAEPFFQADPEGFFAGEMNGEIVATVSLVRYRGDLAFGGFFMVRPDVRGHGVGREILSFFLERARGRNTGIDGVAEMVPTYEKNGFRFCYWNHRFRGVGGGTAPSGLVHATEVPFSDLLEYDMSIFSAPRETFLRSFISQEGTTALVSSTNGKIAGYGAIRPCRVGYKIGPLFADDLNTAEKILKSLISTIPGEPYFLDVPEINKDGLWLANSLQTNEVFRTARLYTVQAPDIPINKVFGVTSFELG
jgi:GNAT superfamily N-acetyltransferase